MEQNKDQLGKEFEDWLDSDELTKPMPIPEEKTDVKNISDPTDLQKTSGS